MQTLYCQGRIYAEQEDWQQAMICFKEAEDLSEKTDDLYFKVLLNSFLSHMYYVNYDNESSLKYAQKTLNMFDDGCFNEEWKREQLMSVANLLDQNGCISQSDSIFHIIFNQLDTTMASSSELIYSARSAMGKKHMDPIRNAIYTERAIAQGDSLDVGDSYQYCSALLLMGRFTEFQSLLDSLRLLPSSLNSNYWNYKISRRLNDYEAALSYCEDFASEKIQDMIAKNNHSIHKVQIDYLKALSDLRRTQVDRNRMLLLLIVLSFLILLLILGAFYHRQKRAREETINNMSEWLEENERLLTLTQNNLTRQEDNNRMMLSRNQALSVDIQTLRKALYASYQPQLASLGKTIEQYFLCSDEDRLHKRSTEQTLTKIHRIIQDIKNREQGQKDLETEINQHLDNIVTKLRADFPNLRDDDLLFIDYMIAQFDTSTIAFLTDYTKSHIRVKKSRYRKLIFSRNTPNTELYRAVFQTKRYTPFSLD